MPGRMGREWREEVGPSIQTQSLTQRRKSDEMEETAEEAGNTSVSETEESAHGFRQFLFGQ